MSRGSLGLGPVFAWSLVAICGIVVGWSLPIDDFWLTLASGRAIVGGADPTTPMPFSWTQEIPGALNPQWGAQLLMGGAGSLSIALAVNAFLIAVGLAVTAVRGLGRASGMAVVVALLLTMVALAPHLLARAQSFSIALLPVALLLLERGSERRWLPLAYGLLIVGWANLHGAFVVGQLAAVVWLVAAVAQRRPLAVPLLTAVVAALAPLLNPVGPALLAYAYGQPGQAVVTAISVEWQPSWPWIAVATPFWAILVAVIVGRFLRRFGAPLPDLLLLLLLALLAIGAIRHIPWFLLAAAPVLASDIEAGLARRPRLGRALGSLPASLSGRRARTTIGILGVVVIGIQLFRPGMPPGIARLTPDEPVAVADRLAEQVVAGDRILNEQVWGGYLADRLWPRLETAMDGRLEIRSVDEWERYFALMNGRDAPADVLEAEGVGWAIIGQDRGALRTELEGAGWELVVDDGYAVLLRDPGGGS